MQTSARILQDKNLIQSHLMIANLKHYVQSSIRTNTFSSKQYQLIEVGVNALSLDLRRLN